MVRLEVERFSQLPLFVELFQFQNGTIRSRRKLDREWKNIRISIPKWYD